MQEFIQGGGEILILKSYGNQVVLSNLSIRYKKSQRLGLGPLKMSEAEFCST